MRVSTHDIQPALVVALLLFSSAAISCQQGGNEEVSTTNDIESVMEVHVPELMSIVGVTAVGIGELPDGSPCIKVYVVKKTDELVRKIPAQLEGHPVVIEESGEIKPLESN